MNSDMIRALTNSLGAVIIIGGGMGMLFVLTKDGIISGDAMLAIIGPLIGLAGAYLLTKDASTNATRAATNAVQVGLAAGQASGPTK